MFKDRVLDGPASGGKGSKGRHPLPRGGPRVARRALEVERQSDRDKERETQTQRERETETEKQRERERGGKREREREGERGTIQTLQGG